MANTGRFRAFQLARVGIRVLESLEQGVDRKVFLLENLLFDQLVGQSSDNHMHLEFVHRELGHLRVQEAPSHGFEELLARLASSLLHSES